MNELDNHNTSGSATDRLPEEPVAASAPHARAGRMTPRRWLFSLVAMGGAVAVVATLNQPPPATPASGLSVPVRAASAAPVPKPVSTMEPVLVVSGTTTTWYQPNDIAPTVQGLPRGAHAREAFGLLGGAVVIIGVDSTGMPQAYFAQHGQLRRLGPAESAVLSADRRSVWLVNYGLIRQVDSFGRTLQHRWQIPTGTNLIGANSYGLIVSGAPHGHTWIVNGHRPPRFLVTGRAVAVTEHRVLIVRGGAFLLVDFNRRVVQRLPWPPALVPTGPATVSPNGRHYAMIARSGGRQRLVVGGLLGRHPQSPHVVPLDGGVAGDTSAPVWVGDSTVVAARPDGQLVAYKVGEPHGWLLSDGPKRVVALAAV